MNKKNKIKKELLLHYHNLLSKGKDTRKDGLSWIIRAIWNLKTNVLIFSLLLILLHIYIKKHNS